MRQLPSSKSWRRRQSSQMTAPKHLTTQSPRTPIIDASQSLTKHLINIENPYKTQDVSDNNRKHPKARMVHLQVLPSTLAQADIHRSSSYSSSSTSPSGGYRSTGSSADTNSLKTGMDLDGNTYWEMNDTLNRGRPRRMVKYKDYQRDYVDYKLTRNPSPPSSFFPRPCN